MNEKNPEDAQKALKVRSPVADEIWSAKFELGLNLMNLMFSGLEMVPQCL